jgi:pSer/pThr/pTyr-binding forkhead associated (FHA) protein
VKIRDVGSSSGSFLNGVRLSEATKASEPFDVQSGDCIQVGKDYVNPKLRGQKVGLANGIPAFNFTPQNNTGV